MADSLHLQHVTSPKYIKNKSNIAKIQETVEEKNATDTNFGMIWGKQNQPICC
jgi:hypothetical protein